MGNKIQESKPGPKQRQIRTQRRGEGVLVLFVWVCAAYLSEPLPHYTLFCGQLSTPILVHFGEEVTTFQPQTFIFFLVPTYQKFLTPKTQKMCNPHTKDKGSYHCNISVYTYSFNKFKLLLLIDLLKFDNIIKGRLMEKTLL